MSERRGNREARDPDESCLSPTPLAFDVSVLEQVSLRILDYTGQTIVVEFRSIPGNHPQTNGNRLWLWEGRVIDWAHPNLGINDPVCIDESRGTCAMAVEISHKDYIVGYSVTGGVMGICGSALLEAGLLMLAPMSVTIRIDSVTTESLTIAYATLRGYQPLRAGNWLGLWRGDQVPWDAPAPIQVRLPEDDANEGLVTFHTPLRAKSTYTVIYFMAEIENPRKNTTAAAVLRFDT